MVAELTTYRVPEDPTSPTPAEGYVVSFVAFYKWGLGTPSAPVPLLIVTTLWPIDAQPDPLQGLAHSGLHDSM
jgi:hypothetical protein